MATLNQIKVNTGTEANPTYVLHDVHDKRLDDGASSLVTTCTHLLATNAALSSFNPITSANLASVLGVPKTYTATGFAGNFFRKICSFPVGSAVSASFIVGAAKAQYNAHYANFTHNITLSYKPNQADDNPIKEEPLLGSTSALEFYYKKRSEYIDVYCQFPSYNDAAWLTVLYNNGVDFSGVFGTTSETMSTCVKCETPFPDLTELASALGGVSGNVDSLLPVVFDAVPNEAAMDNIYSNGLYIHASLTGMGYGGVFCIGYGNAESPKFTQLDVSSTRIRVRSNTGSGWTSWNVIATY